MEASKMPGEGQLHLTGSLGKVIQESAKIALSWVKTNAFALKLTSHPNEKLIGRDDIHIHFPSGSIPKDGPSAGKRHYYQMIIKILILLRCYSCVCSCFTLFRQLCAYYYRNDRRNLTPRPSLTCGWY